jgi:AraC-like DNA-binding protein
MIPTREHICYQPNASFASFVRGWPRISCSYHLHEEYELVHIITSEGSLLAGDGMSVFNPGDIFFLGSNLPHIFRNWPGLTYGRAGARSHVIQFRHDFLGPEFFNAPELRPVLRFLSTGSRGFRLKGPLRTELSEAMKKIHEEEGPSRISGLLNILQKMAFSPRHLVPLSGFSAGSAATPVDTRLERVFDYIYENFTQEVTFERATQLACMTPSAFSRYFRKSTTLPFTEFLNRLRISNACRLLIKVDAPVTKVAFDCGYDNLSYFNRQFKRIAGQSPREFRSQACG